MADATVNSSYDTVEGNQRVVYASLTWGNGDTFVTGLATVNGFSFETTTAAAHGITQSSGTLTLVSGGALTGQLRVVGF
jgi:hypothetical protein